MLHLHTFQNNNFKTKEGYVALMSVLVVSAVGAVIAVSLLTTGILYQHSSFTLEEGYIANALVEACSNIALEKILQDSEYGGNESIYFGNNKCDILNISKNENTYTVNIVGGASSTLRKNKIIVNRIVDGDTLNVKIVLVSWQEIADF